MEENNDKIPAKGNEPKVEFRRVNILRHNEDGGGTWYPGVMGVIRDESGKEIAFSGCIEGFEAMIWSAAEDIDKLGENLGGLLELFLERSLHNDPGVFSEIAGNKFFHN